MLEISAIENLCSQKKWAKVHQIFFGMIPPKTSHHAKFHRDRSNQLGDRGRKKISTHTHTYTASWLLESRSAVREARLKRKKRKKLTQAKYITRSAGLPSGLNKYIFLKNNRLIVSSLSPLVCYLLLISCTTCSATNPPQIEPVELQHKRKASVCVVYSEAVFRFWKLGRPVRRCTSRI